MARVVIGANYGDEGKGLATDWAVRLAEGSKLVVRFNGGSQAGHTAETPEGQRHIFSHFSSGSFAKADTYLGRNFICNPITFKMERERMSKVGLDPIVIVNPQCRVTTYLDMMANQLIEASRTKRHGSCGLGIFETFLRHRDKIQFTIENDPPPFDVLMDYFIERLRTAAPEMIAFADKQGYTSRRHYVQWLEDYQLFLRKVQVFAMKPGRYENVVFEGAQGLLLDMDYVDGAPHLTPSNTGLYGTVQDMQELGVDSVDVFYVTRSYLTRHGAGPLVGEVKFTLPDQTNMPNEFQGTLRFAPLDPMDLVGRISNDRARFQAAMPSTEVRTHLMVTHTNSLHEFTDDPATWYDRLQNAAEAIQAETWSSNDKTHRSVTCGIPILAGTQR